MCTSNAELIFLYLVNKVKLHYRNGAAKENPDQAIRRERQRSFHLYVNSFAAQWTHEGERKEMEDKRKGGKPEEERERDWKKSKTQAEFNLEASHRRWSDLYRLQYRSCNFEWTPLSSEDTEDPCLDVHIQGGRKRSLQHAELAEWPDWWVPITAASLRRSLAIDTSQYATTLAISKAIKLTGRN